MLFQALLQGLPLGSRHGQRLVAGSEVPREWPALCPQYGKKEAAAWQFSQKPLDLVLREEGSHADNTLLTPLLRAANLCSGHSWQTLSIGSPSGDQTGSE